MERLGITAEAACLLLRRLSQESEGKLHLIADLVVWTCQLPTTTDLAASGQPTGHALLSPQPA